MKKLATLLLVLSLITTLVACGKAPHNADIQATDTQSSIVENVSTNNTEKQTDIPSQSDSKETIAENSQTTETQNTQDVQQNTQPPVQAHTHAYSKQITAPTCTAEGYTVYTCNCGHTYTADYKSALNHIYTKTVTPATCSAQGYTTHTCSLCGHNYNDGYTTASHSYSSTVTLATCTTQGYTTYTCSVCGHNYKDNYTQATHNYLNYKCSTCGTVDKSHAYEYLSYWVKQNGQHSNTDIHIQLNQSGVHYRLSHSKTYNYLSIFRFETFEDIEYSTLIKLDDYMYSYSADSNDLYGYINPQTYNYDSTVSYSSYYGDNSVKDDVIECANMDLSDLVDYLDWCLKHYNVGITITDLGFTSWVSQY